MDQFDDSDGPDLTEVRAVLRLRNGDLGTGAERQAIETLAEQLEQALADSDAGEFEGEEFGGGECVLFFSAADVDRLIDILRPLLARSPLAPGACLLRFIAREDGQLEERRLPL